MLHIYTPTFESLAGARHPLDTSVGSIGIDGGFGSSAGGGLGSEGSLT